MPRAGLENEDYIAYLDESGEDGLQVVAGILIPARWLRGAERRWRDFIRGELDSKSGRLEIKGRDLLAGKGVSLQAQQTMLAKGASPLSARAAGQLFYRDALKHIAGIHHVRVLAVGLPTSYPLEVYRLWFWMAYALLVENSRAPRPRLPMVVIDGEDASFRAAQELVAYRFHHAFPRCQPYVGKGSQWFIGGSVHQDSRLHPFIQMADLVAGAARHSIVGRKPQGTWYARHLTDHHRIDVSAHALSQLKRRSRADACGSGWRSTRLASRTSPQPRPSS